MIKIENLTKEFRSGRGQVRALSGISLELPQGVTAAIYGKSGSGKTTLLNCIGGLERPEAGKVVCFGNDIHSLTSRDLSLFQRKHMGFVFQQGNLLSYLNVFENIAFPLVLNNASKQDKENRVKELLEKIGLKGAGKAMPQELSGGEMQRVAVARAIAHCPKLLIADEPTASLDTATGTSLVELLFDLGREGKSTVLLSTHDEDIIRLADTGVHIKDGRLVGR
ncbi:MAG: ABC transporter ATP-binding protein [Deltaproteobacteria bacterium]|nr:ABC transporter ATP-binding protein [Deltaproteobacteria bacterium]